MNKFIVLALFVLAIPLSASEINPKHKQLAKKEYPTETLYQLWVDYRKNKQSLIEFYDGLTEKHIVELKQGNPNRAIVTYFARGSADTDYILQSGGPDFYGLRFKQIGSSGIYFCIQEIPNDAWFNYGVNEFKRTQPHEVGGVELTSMEHIYDGAVFGPAAPLSPYIYLNQNVPKGELLEVTLNSTFMNEARKVSIYIPANYNEEVAHNLVLQFDGENYSAGPEKGPAWQGWTPMPTVLDNLIHERKITPTIAIFIHNQGNRSGNLISKKMTDFVAIELVDWVRENYNISHAASNVVVSGASRGGFAAANTAFHHSNIIGSVLSQSGSFYYTDDENWPIYPEFEGELVLNYKNAENLGISFYLDVGLYDLGLGRVGVNRQLRDILELKGYKVDYYQYKGGHSYIGWRHTLAKGLISLLALQKN